MLGSSFEVGDFPEDGKIRERVGYLDEITKCEGNGQRGGYKRENERERNEEYCEEKGNERGEDDEKENGCSYSSDLSLQIRFLHITEIFS